MTRRNGAGRVRQQEPQPAAGIFNLMRRGRGFPSAAASQRELRAEIRPFPPLRTVRPLRAPAGRARQALRAPGEHGPLSPARAVPTARRRARFGLCPEKLMCRAGGSRAPVSVDSVCYPASLATPAPPAWHCRTSMQLTASCALAHRADERGPRVRQGRAIGSSRPQVISRDSLCRSCAWCRRSGCRRGFGSGAAAFRPPRLRGSFPLAVPARLARAARPPSASSCPPLRADAVAQPVSCPRALSPAVSADGSTSSPASARPISRAVFLTP